MTETNTKPMRIAGGLLAFCALGTLVLLSIHPGEGGKSFAEAMRAEAEARMLNGVVHGGFVALLALELAALAVLAQQIKRPAMMAGLALFALGVVALSASLLVDGVVLPALAVKYVGLPDKLEFAKSLFTLCGAFIGTAMPTGLALQSGGVLFFGLALAHAAKSRISGVIGILSGLAAVVGIGSMGLQPIVVIVTVASLGLWLAGFGVLALRDQL